LREPFSDLFTGITLSPSKYFGMNVDTNLDTQTEFGTVEFSSWSTGLTLKDDRGDVLKGRFTYVEDAVTQIEGNIELALSDRLKVAYYGRYDDLEGEFLDQRAVLRLYSACDCWHLDFGRVQKDNPDKTTYLFTFTFTGLGDVTQKVTQQDEDSEP
jgi:hypothetical protein